MSKSYVRTDKGTSTAAMLPKMTFREITQMVMSGNTVPVMEQRMNPWDKDVSKIKKNGAETSDINTSLNCKKISYCCFIPKFMYVFSSFTVRTKLTGTLLRLNSESQRVLRSYIIPTVLHKVSEFTITKLLHKQANTIAACFHV